jgi:hydrogenase maturation factor
VLSTADPISLGKSAGIEGTAILAAALADRMRGTVDEATLARARAFIERISIVPDGRIGARCGATAMHDVTEGGVLTGAWELADASKCGVRLDADSVPVAPETQAICAALGADPLALISSGSMLIAVPEPRPLQSELAAAGIGSAVIGALTERERRIVCDGATLDLVPLGPRRTVAAARGRGREGMIGRQGRRRLVTQCWERRREIDVCMSLIPWGSGREWQTGGK